MGADASAPLALATEPIGADGVTGAAKYRRPLKANSSVVTTLSQQASYQAS